MTSTDKKEWSTPRLRVFVRTRTEETLLLGCKISSVSGPVSDKSKCTTGKGCGKCSVVGTS